MSKQHYSMDDRAEKQALRRMWTVKRQDIGPKGDLIVAERLPGKYTLHEANMEIQRRGRTNEHGVGWTMSCW